MRTTRLPTSSPTTRHKTISTPHPFHVQRVGDAGAELLAACPVSGVHLSRVLLTSRFSDWGDWAEDVPLDVLSSAEAEALLRERAMRPSDPGAFVLAEALGRLPLALGHAAAFCKRAVMRFEDYATRAEAMMASLPRGVPYPRSVAATLDLALGSLAGNAPAETLIAFLAYCAPERVPMLLLEGAVEDTITRAAALIALTELSLVRHDAFDDAMEAVTMHRLVQSVARTRVASSGGAAAAVAGVIGSVRISVCEACSASPTIG